MTTFYFWAKYPLSEGVLTRSRGASFWASLVTGSKTATTSKYTSSSFGLIFTAL